MSTAGLTPVLPVIGAQSLSITIDLRWRPLWTVQTFINQLRRLARSRKQPVATTERTHAKSEDRTTQATEHLVKRQGQPVVGQFENELGMLS